MVLRKILIVDDDTVNRIILRKILSADYDVLEAGNGREALQAMQESSKLLSAVLLDLSMPMIDGYEVLKKMRADPALAQIPVIVTTGNTEEAAEVRALSLGANDYLTKPYNAAIIRHRIRNTINLRETASAVNALRRDKLTGLLNREAFFERAAAEIRARIPGYYVLSCFDINNFKVINDQYGTERGDRVLRFVADTIRRAFEPYGGLLGRITADHFALLYPSGLMGSPLIEQTRREAERLDGSIPPITLSIGRYIVDDPALPVNAMYDRAAMARASIKGRYDAHVAVYDASMRDHILREQQVVTEMNTALAEGQFEPWFQPQYNHMTGALIGAEALVRWRHPKNGLLVPPGDFIPVFERNGFIYEMDKFIWERVCQLLRGWIDGGRTPLPISVNISRYDLFREDFFSVLTGLVERYAIPIGLLRLEVTETAFAKSAERVVSMVKRLIQYGFTVEIDDFGSGYSSLNTLKDVPATVLKLDMKFLENSGDSQRGGNILESIVRMSKWIGMSVIAEGVETREQADYLASIGCYYIQGYYYARPMPVDEYERLAAASSKEAELRPLETAPTLNNHTFWDPNSMDTLIFNSYVGGACIIEFHNERAELLRINKKYAEELGIIHQPDDPLSVLDPENQLDPENLAILHRNIHRAIETDDESTCEVRMLQGDRVIHIRSTVRVIARTSGRYLLYCSIINVTGLRASEQRAREATAELETFMNDTPGGFCRLQIYADWSTRLIYANDGFCKLVGMTRAEVFSLFGQDSSEGLHPDDRAAVAAAYRGIAQDGRFHLKYRLRHGKEGYLWVMVYGRMVRSESGDMFLNSYYTDVARQTQLEEQRQELLENLPCGAGIYEIRDGGIRATYLNRRYRSFLGREIGELAEAPVLEVVHPEDRARVWSALQSAIGSLRESSCDIRIADGRGGYLPFRLVGTVAERSEDRTVIYVTYTPISREEVTLQEMLPFLLAAIMESSTDLSFAKDRDFQYICASRAFAAMAGLDNESEVVGKTDYDLFRREIADKYRGDDLRLLESGRSLIDMIEAIPSLEDGVPRYSRTSKYLLRDTAGNTIGIYGVGRDITEYRTAFEQLKLLTDSIPGGLATYELTKDGMRLLYFSDGYFRHTGYTKEEYRDIAEKNPTALVFPEDLPIIGGVCAAVLAGQETFSYEYRARCKGGSFRWLNIQGVAVSRREGAATVNVVKFDITQRKAAEEQLRMSEEQYRLAQQQSGNIMCRFDVVDRSVNMSEDVAAVFQMPVKVTDVPDAPVREGTIAKRSAEAYTEFYQGILKGEPTGEACFECRTRQGWRWMRAVYSTIFSNAGKPVSAVISMQDVTEQRRRDAEHRSMLENDRRLQRQAETDGMTDTLNRTATESLIRSRLASSGRNPSTLLIADLDDLKQINDTLGHPQGDRALQEIARTLKEMLRESDIVGRIGGDEFIAFLDGMSDRRRIAEQMRFFFQKLETVCVGENNDFPVRASVGIAVNRDGADTLETMYQKADKALYYAKRNGKKQFAFYSPEIESEDHS